MIGRIIQPTADGSFTVYDERVGECFHSIHGAVQESLHVFIRSGFDWCPKNTVRILEIGFGTGLNAYLTLRRAIETKKEVEYETIELYPLDIELVKSFARSIEDEALLLRLHEVPWGLRQPIMPGFLLTKIQADVTLTDFSGIFDVVYFDAFSPEKQPELWTEEIFDRLYTVMSDTSVLVTYCAKGEIKRRLRRVGFTVEGLPGPPGKREITRAIKMLK